MKNDVAWELRSRTEAIRDLRAGENREPKPAVANDAPVEATDEPQLAPSPLPPKPHLTDLEQSVLGYLAEHQPATGRQIGAAIGVEWKSVRNIMANLNRNGLIERHPWRRNAGQWTLPEYEGPLIEELQRTGSRKMDSGVCVAADIDRMPAAWKAGMLEGMAAYLEAASGDTTQLVAVLREAARKFLCE